jgi:hypothetical protein
MIGRTLIDQIRVNNLMLKIEIEMAIKDFIYCRQRRSISFS